MGWLLGLSLVAGACNNPPVPPPAPVVVDAGAPLAAAPPPPKVELAQEVDAGLPGPKPIVPPVMAEAAPPASARLGDVPQTEELKGHVQSYFQGAVGRRIYIQVDKPIYKPGETIWIKTWDLQARSLEGSAKVKGIHYRLISPKGAVVQQKQVHQLDGLATNDFELPADLQGGEYTLRVAAFDGVQAERPVIVSTYEPPRLKLKLEFVRKAYGEGDEVTATLEVKRGTGEALGNKEVAAAVRLDGADLPRVKLKTNSEGNGLVRFNLPRPIRAGDGLLTVLVEDAGVTESISKRIPIVVHKLQFAAFPEGGKMISGLPGRLYFEAKTPLGKPADVEGQIVDDLGNAVVAFKSYKDGMGRVAFTPATGRTYQASITKPEGVTEKYALPLAQAEGCALRSFDDLDGQLAALRVSVTCTQARKVFVSALLRENLLDAAAVETKAGEPVVVYLEPKDAALAKAQGIARVTVFDDQLNPLAERLVFRNRRARLNVKVEPDQKRYGPRDPVSLKLTTTDSSGAPVAAELALSVVDDAVISFADDKTGHLLSKLLLESEIPGKVEEPNPYFDLTEEKSAQAMDLLMGTRGWRTFEWQPVLHPRPVASTATLDTGATRSASAAMPAPPEDRPMPLEHREMAKPAARFANQGVLGALKVAPAGNFADLLGQVPGDANGIQGLGMKGTGQGGGGQIGLGGIGTIGRGGGYGVGLGRGIRGPTPEVNENAPAQVQGSLDKDLIRRVWHMNRNQLRFCYERELMRNPNLEGRLGVKFVIGASGEVSMAQISQSTIGNPELEACVAARVKTWHFPKPAGGGVVIVNYPVTFHPGDGDGPAPNDWRPAPQAPPPIAWAPVRVFPAPAYTAEDLAKPRTDFRETIHWAPSVKTDAQGQATVRFYTSDAVTSFRIFTEGVGKGLAGRDETVISSSLPFSMSVKLPTEVSAGDVLNLPLTLANERDKELDVTVDSSFGSLLSLQGEAAKGGALAGQTRRSLFFPVKVTGQSGESEVRFAARTGSLKDEFVRQVKVTRLGFPQQLSRSGKVKGTLAEEFDLGEAIPGSADVTLKLDPSPVATLVSGLEGMLREPSGCFEQTSSTNYPNVMVMGYLRSHDVADPALLARSGHLLESGYRKLTGYESPNKGYEWFGGDPGHEALTAYGLLEFADMKRVYGNVDEAMLERTIRWLKGRRDGQGGYLRDAKALDSFGRAAPEVTNAYITYAMVRAGETDLAPEIEASAKLAQSTSDAYLLALASNTLLHAPGRREAGRAAASRLASLQDADGSWKKEDHSITRSGGSNLWIETTSLSVLALLEAGGHDEAVRKGVTWLHGNRSGFGQWGATQATVLALQAMTAYEEANRKPPSPGKVSVKVNGEPAGEVAYEAGRREPIVFPGLGSRLKPGKNTIELTSTSPDGLPYSLAVEFRSLKPANSPESQVTLEASLEKSQLKLGEAVRLNATVTNKTQSGLPMTLARIGLPGGLTFQNWQLKELREKGLIAFYETRAREVILYFRDMKPAESKRVPLDLVAFVPGHYTGPASSAYLYYNDQHKTWAEPLAMQIDP